ncbi:TPA: hypothetical protein ACSTJY_001647 [Serratia fonticola]
MNNLNPFVSLDSLTVELLILMNTSDSFCNTNDSFNSLLKSNSEIKIKNNQLHFKNSSFHYKLTSGDINEQQGSSRYFNVKLRTDDINSSNTELLTELIRQVKIIIGKITDYPAQTIWDDLSYYYSVQAYPLIHEIENILRKLITKFMLVNVGASWPRDSIPDALKTSSREGARTPSSRDRTNNHNILYDTDFIKLSDFLFEEYREFDVSELIKKLKNLTLNPNESTKELEDVLKFIPKSNWDRYFSSHINCADVFLKKKWTRLYELRCQIAHNNTFSKANLEETIKIISEIKPFLEEATEKLEDIVVPTQEKENLVDSIELKEIDELALDTEPEIQKFMRNVGVVSYLISRIAKLSPSFEQTDSYYESLEKLEKHGILEQDPANFCRYVVTLRNDIDKFNSLDNSEIAYINKAFDEYKKVLLRIRDRLAHYMPDV